MPLHVVVQSWHTERVQILLDLGADIEVGDDRGDTPLDRAIIYGSGVVVQVLLKRVVLSGRDADGKTPMERAVRGWDVLNVDVLAKNGRHFPTHHRAMQRVMMLYTMRQGPTKDEKTQPSGDA